MPSVEDLNKLWSEIQAIEMTRVMKPNMPVSLYIQEAEDLFLWCRDDQTALVKAGLNWDLACELPDRAAACRKAQTEWTKELKTPKPARKNWAEQVPTGLDLRNCLIHDFRFAFRNRDDILAQVVGISQGNSIPDLIQDLNDLSVLGNAHPELLNSIGFESEKLGTATSLAEQLSTLLGILNSETRKTNEIRIIRNKAFTYLKQAVGAVRECGQYVFWRNPERLIGYSSTYWKQKNKIKKKTDSEVSE